MRRISFLLSLILILSACGRNEGEPPGDTMAGESGEEAYRLLQDEARDVVVQWQEQADLGHDPRPGLARRLEEFARTYPRSPRAGDALAVALELMASARDTEGFFDVYDEALQTAPDTPGLRARLDDLRLMRMVQAGGLGVTATTDGESRRQAYRKAAPFLIEDLDRLIEAAGTDETKAAAQFAAGRVCYELAVDLECARKHFETVVAEYPDFHRSAGARLYLESLTQLAVGMKAPNFGVQPVSGKRVALERLRGKVVLVNFWATWCQSCVDDLPVLKRVYRRYRARGFEIISISVDRDVGGAREFIVENEIPWPVVASGKGLEDEIAGLFRVQDIPMSFLIDRKGVIIGRSLFGRDVGRAAGASVLGTPEEP